MDVNSIAFSELGQELVAGGKPLRLRVAGTSMAPFLQEGDFIEVTSVRREDLRMGDLLVFQRAGGVLTVHRFLRWIVEDAQAPLLTKGDATGSLDELVPFQRIIGRVVMILREGVRISMLSPRARVINYVLARLTFYRPLNLRIARLFMGLY
jgi:signal peptidase I